jgi:hypothetical protein
MSDVYIMQTHDARVASMHLLYMTETNSGQVQDFHMQEYQECFCFVVGLEPAFFACFPLTIVSMKEKTLSLNGYKCSTPVLMGNDPVYDAKHLIMVYLLKHTLNSLCACHVRCLIKKGENRQ